MATVKVFALYDLKGKFYAPPFVAPTVGMASRSFADIARSPESIVYKHPEDYILYQIGNYDDNSGVLEAVIPPVHIASAIEFQDAIVPKLAAEGLTTKEMRGN